MAGGAGTNRNGGESRGNSEKQGGCVPAWPEARGSGYRPDSVGRHGLRCGDNEDAAVVRQGWCFGWLVRRRQRRGRLPIGRADQRVLSRLGWRDVRLFDRSASGCSVGSEPWERAGASFGCSAGAASPVLRHGGRRPPLPPAFPSHTEEDADARPGAGTTRGCRDQPGRGFVGASSACAGRLRICIDVASSAHVTPVKDNCNSIRYI